jgi:hypothetical protein
VSRLLTIRRIWRGRALWAAAGLAIGCAGDPGETPRASCSASSLYGIQGEAWNPSGRLLDYAYAGYHTGSEALPTVTAPAVSVADYGARPDDGEDDTQAFLTAIAASTSGVIQVPPGRFVLMQRLEIRKGNLVLRGAGRDRTTLFFPFSLGELYGLEFNSAGQSNWSFSGGFLTVEGSVGGGLLARVTAPAARGARTLQVSTTTGLAAGQWVRLLQTDAGGTLLKAFHAGYYDGDVGEDIGRQAFRFLSRIESVGGGAITLERPLPLEVETAWSPEVRSLSPSVREVGVEELTIEFPGTRYPGHFKENGYNAIYFNGVVDSWVRNVSILNSDYGVNVNGSFFCTVDGVTVGTSFDRGPLVGHHALTSAGGADHLFTRFDVRSTFVHDLSVDSYTLGSVWADGRGIDLNLDHHGRGNYGTLWTRLDLGAGTRPFASGGTAPLRMPHSGARTAYWNVTAARDIALPPSDFGPLLSFVAVKGSAGRPPADWFVEPMAAPSLCQEDLHAAMLARRRR